MALRDGLNSSQMDKQAFISLITSAKPSEDKIFKNPHGKENHKRKARSSSSQRKRLKDDHMSEETRKKFTEFLKKRDKARVYMPVCSLLPSGKSAQLTVAPEERIPLKLSDIQDALMFSSLNQQSYLPRWCKVKKIGYISRIMCVIVEGVSVDDYLKYQHTMSQVKDTYDLHLEFLPPSITTVTEGLGAVPITENQKMMLYKGSKGITFDKEKKMGYVKKDFKNLIKLFAFTGEQTRSETTIRPEKIKKKDRCTKKDLLLSLEEMLKTGFPVPLEAKEEKCKGYKMLKKRYDEVTDSSPLFSVDCEMCITTSGRHEVTRVAVVDENLQVVYHTYVKPRNHIIDYLTPYSGIMKASLEGVTTTLEEVQEALDSILPADAILIGHYLISDLHALMVMHPYVIDTAFTYNLSGFIQTKPSLSLLSQVFLKENIQDLKLRGHDPREDALAAMKLVKLKLRNELSYGNVVLNGYIPPIDEDMAKYAYSMKMLRMMEVNNVSGLVICNQSLSSQYNEAFAPHEDQIVSLSNNKEVVCTACERMLESQVIIVGMDMRKREGLKESHMRSLDRRLSKLYHHADYKSMVIVLLTESEKNGACLVKIKPDPSLPYWTWNE